MVDKIVSINWRKELIKCIDEAKANPGMTEEEFENKIDDLVIEVTKEYTKINKPINDYVLDTIIQAVNKHKADKQKAKNKGKYCDECEESFQDNGDIFMKLTVWNEEYWFCSAVCVQRKLTDLIGEDEPDPY